MSGEDFLSPDTKAQQNPSRSIQFTHKTNILTKYSHKIVCKTVKAESAGKNDRITEIY